MIPNFAYALKNHLRRVHLEEELEPANGFSTESKTDVHLPNHIAGQILNYSASLERSGKLKPEHLLMLHPELTNFTDATGACERIRNTPIPYSYSVFLKKFMFMYVMTLPFGFVFSLGYLTIPVVAVIFYVLASLELIAEEIEDPFGVDANDLPTDEIAAGIRKTVKEILA
jgi:putative membrane protein